LSLDYKDLVVNSWSGIKDGGGSGGLSDSRLRGRPS